MKLHLEWSRQVPLKRSRQRSLVYTIDMDKLPDEPGLYVFGRRFGNSFEALYVGKAKTIRRRVRNQLNNSRLMQHVMTARRGKRILLVGRYVSKPGQDETKNLLLLEQALIRHFVSEGDDLVNKHGTRIRQHEITSVRKQLKKFIPATMYLEKT